MKAIKYLLFTLLVLYIGILLSTKTYALTSANITRLEGVDRYKTSVEISKSAWEDGSSETAMLATGENYPDALSAAPLAQKLDAPILLTNKDHLTSDTEIELNRLGVKEVYIIGGTGAVSVDVENKLKSMGIIIIRLGGADRYETSIKIAEQLDSPKQLAVTTGDDFSDALSIAPFAASSNMPIILVPKDYVPESVKNYLSTVNIDKTYIVGESDIISDTVANSFKNPYRIMGNDKYQRNISVINTFLSDLQLHALYIATGSSFPDALSGSVIAAKKVSPILIVDNVPVNVTANFIEQNKNLITEYIVLGGEGAVSTSILSVLLPVDSIPKSSVDLNEPNKVVNINFNDLSVNGITKRESSYVMGNFIYYSQYSDDEGKGLFKANLDKSNPVKLVNGIINGFILYGNVIFYIDGKLDLRRVRIDGTNDKAIFVSSGDVIPSLVCIKDNLFYFNCPSEGIYRMGIDGSNLQLILRGEIDNMDMDNSWIYYCDYSNNQLCKVDLNGNNKQILVEYIYPYNIKADNDWVYYEESRSDKSYRIRKDGTDNQTIDEIIYK